jgi:hypothetical protein
MTFRIATLPILVSTALLVACGRLCLSGSAAGAVSSAAAAPPSGVAGRWTLHPPGRVMRDDAGRRPWRNRGHHRAGRRLPFTLATFVKRYHYSSNREVLLMATRTWMRHFQVNLRRFRQMLAGLMAYAPMH